ncbi:MAG: biotin--[acetyl-CoA-carboxylase] ligase [Actinomycetes bacterium]
METPNATSNDENLPGSPFLGKKIGNFSDSWTVRWISTTGSTNEDLVAAARRGAPDRLVLVADHQSAGRGRLDRTWEAPHGANLLVSLLFRSVPQFPHALTHAVALAAQSACLQVMLKADAEVAVELKWPNDLLADGRKLAGILSAAGPLGTTVSSSGESLLTPQFVVVGLGLNVAWAPREAACLSEFANNMNVDRDAVLGLLLKEMDVLLALDPMQLHERYRANLSTLQRDIRVELPQSRFLEGRAIDVEVDGRLVVMDSQGLTHRLDIGDMVHLR